MNASRDDALRDILEDAQRRLAGIRLEVPGLGDGKPAAPSPSQWAAAELALPGEVPPAAPPAASAPSVRPPEPEPVPAAEPPARAPSPAATPERGEVQPLAEAPVAEAPVERVASAPVEPDPAPEPAPRPARPEPPPTPRAAPAWLSPWRTRPVTAAAALGLAAAAAALVILRGATPPRAPAVRAEDGRWYSAGEREVVVRARGAEPARLPLRSTWRSLALTPGWVWGMDGQSSTVERVSEDGSNARSFQLDHVPAALFGRHPHLWTIDPSRRQARQYLVAESMLGTFLQPLDARRLPLPVTEADLFVEEDGRLLVLERGSAALSVVDGAGRACASPVSSGARLVSDRGRPALIVETGGSRALRGLPKLCVPAP